VLHAAIPIFLGTKSKNIQAQEMMWNCIVDIVVLGLRFLDLSYLFDAWKNKNIKHIPQIVVFHGDESLVESVKNHQQNKKEN